MSAFDPQALRAEFPILSEEIYGRPFVYLDNAASAQKPRAVIEAMTSAMEHEYANVHRGLHYMANQTTEAYEEARATAAKFLNAAHRDEIIFTRGSTEAINLVAASYGQIAIEEGDEIVVSLLEHHSNIVPWHFLRERKGAVLKWVPVLEDGRLDMDAYAAMLGPRTKIVALTHMSNALGAIVDVKEAARLAHEAGAKILIDGSQGAVHLGVDVQDLDVDFYACTGHKLYGPTGIGILWGRHELLDAMPPYQGGGEMIETVSMENIVYGPVPQRFEAGTPPILEAIGLNAALNFMMSLDRQEMIDHETGLLEAATERLQALNSIHIYGTGGPKGAIISFSLEGAHAHDVATILDRSGIAVRAGTHCAEPLMQHFGVTSTVRASFGLYNIADEVEALGRGVEKAIEFLR